MFDPPGVEDLWGYNPIFGQPVATPAVDWQEPEPTSEIETTLTNFSNDDDSALLDQLIQGPTCTIFGNLFESEAPEEFSYDDFPYQPLVTSLNGNMADQPDHFTNYEVMDFSAATQQQLQHQPCPDSSTGPAPEVANLSMIETGKGIESSEHTACDLDLNQDEPDEVTSSTSFQPFSSMNILNSPSTMTNGSGCLTPARLSGKNTTIFAKKSSVKHNPASKVYNFKNQEGIIGQQAQQDEQVLHTCKICRREFARYKNLIRHELNFHGRSNEEEKVHAPLVQNSAKPTMIKNKVKMNDTPSSAVLEPDEESPAAGPTSTDEEGIMSRLDTKCNICHRSYSNPGSLRRHQVKVHNLKVKGRENLLERQRHKYECKNCSRIVPYKQLKTHQMSVHNTNVEIYTKYSRIRKQRCSSTYECNICHKKLSSNTILREHQVRIHNVQLEGHPVLWKCNICNKVMSYNNRYDHLKTVHRISGLGSTIKKHFTLVNAPHSLTSQTSGNLQNSTECIICHRNYTSVRFLRQHEVLVHKSQPPPPHGTAGAFECNVCHKNFTRSQTLRHHNANHKQDHLDIVQNSCVGDVDVPIFSLPDKVISPKTPNSSPVKKTPSPWSSPRKELNPPTPTPDSPRKKSKQGDWLRRKLRAHKLILSINAKLLTERCQVKLFDIGFLVDGARATGDEQPTFIVKPLPREEVGNSNAPEAEEDDNNDVMDTQEGQDQLEQILETALKEDKEMQEIDDLGILECEDQQKQILEAAPMEEEPEKVQEEIDDMETHDGEDQQKQILEAAPVEEEPKEVQEISNDLLDKIGEMEMDEISGQESSLSKTEEDVKADKEEARIVTLYKINGKNFKKSKKNGVDPIKSSCSIDLNVVSHLIPFELIRISSTGFYSTVCFINEDTEESPNLASFEPTPISVSQTEAEGEVEVSNACCDLDDKRKAEPTPTQPVKKIKSNTNSKLRVKAEDDAMRLTKCGICKSEVPVIELSTHKMEHEIQCHICLKHVRLSEIRKHGISHIASKVCEICSLQFKSRGALWEHANIHFEVKPIICNYCGIGFVSRKELANHCIVKHTTIAALACPKVPEDEEPEMP